MLNEGLIQSFLTLADTLNFTEAARKLFFTQQALSKQIAKLEQELGSDLFQRDRNHVSLTREGEIYCGLPRVHAPCAGSPGGGGKAP